MKSQSNGKTLEIPDDFLKGVLRIKKYPPKKAEPTPGETAARKVKPPPWLKRRGKKVFRDLTKVITDLSLLNPADYVALGMLSDGIDDYLTYGDAVDKHGPTFVTVNREKVEMVKVNPACALKADAWRRVQSGLAKFGLQPKARDGIKLPAPKPKNRFDDDW